MDRRELIKTIGVLTGAALVGGDLFLAGCKEHHKQLFSQGDIVFFDEVAETIIPRTDTPGAKDAEVGKFMALYAADCYDAEQQDILKQGVTQINNAAKKQFGNGFAQLSAEQKSSLLTRIHEEARRHKAEQGVPVHYFVLMKQLVLLGFFTSKAGATQVLRHLPVPGGYHGCVDYNGETAWG